MIPTTQPDPEPLPGDTGAQSPTAISNGATWHLDWLTCSFFREDADAAELGELISELFHPGQAVPVDRWTATGGAKWYREGWEYLGAQLYGRPMQAGAREHLHLILSGEVCQAVGVDAVLQLAARAEARGYEVRSSRLDLAVDGWPITPAQVRDAVRSGETVSRIRRNEWDGLDVLRHTWTEGNHPGDGTTLTIGDRESERYVRVYDRHGFTRFEVEFKGQTAAGLLGELGQLRGDDAGQGQLVLGMVRTTVDFGTVADQVHGARGIQLAAWWAACVGMADRLSCRLRDVREGLAVDRKLRWLGRSVAPSLALVRRAYSALGRDSAGDELVEYLLQLGSERQGPVHQSALREFRWAYSQGAYAG